MEILNDYCNSLFLSSDQKVAMSICVHSFIYKTTLSETCIIHSSRNSIIQLVELVYYICDFLFSSEDHVFCISQHIMEMMFTCITNSHRAPGIIHQTPIHGL